MRRFNPWYLAMTAGLALTLAGAQAQDDDLMADLPLGGADEAQTLEKPSRPGDPLEPFNRLMYGINDKLYFWVLKPAAQGYKKVVPRDPRKGIQNAFKNLATPIRLVNCAVQGDLQGTGTEFARFAINTTLGGLGFSDPANKKFGIRTRDEDTGQSLGRYGVARGPYLMLPVLGPLTLRDGVGKIGDWFLDPLNWLNLKTWEKTALTGEEIVNGTSLRLGRYEKLKAAAVDPYTAIRSGYLKQRKMAVKDHGQGKLRRKSRFGRW